MTFAEIEPKLKELLADFGRPSAVNTPHNPFWHMQSDGIWQLEGPAALLARPMGATPNLTELRDPAVQGSFTPELLRLLDQSVESTQNALVEPLVAIARQVGFAGDWKFS